MKRSPAAFGAVSNVKVWDPLVRVFHWSLVLGVAASWITHEVGRDAHVPIGYLTLVLVAIRLVWGFVGPRTARFASFVKRPQAVVAYLHQMLAGREARYLGHNPAGAAMILALLAGVVGVGVTGWLYTTDAFWGDELVENLHEGLAVTLLVLASLHVAGVVVASRRHGENLVKAMVVGRKRAPEPGDVV